MKCCLKKGELLVIEAVSESGLRCLKGSLWVTVGDGMDYFVTDRRSSEKIAGKKALIEALEDSEIKIYEMAGTPLAISTGMHRGAGIMAGV